MADPYRVAETGGRPHWFCNYCGRDFTTETAAQFHAEVTHGLTTGPAATPVDDTDVPEPPRPTAPKERWVAYAEALGVDTVDDDGKSLTKKELIERTRS